MDEGSNETVWQMTRSNTKPAGGDDRNRIFDGVITLEPGTYTAHFRTDFSHSFGDFDHEEPHDPASWGIIVERVDMPPARSNR